ncbi:Ecdysone 20-monooxygenase [Eumeta japonica]|uniref:Ecdysone 20-monooxygenase n=1 Tax=Eumeta variegata TaxID=151549 RepID=A0A4C1VC24_EUMVA|nr:Ecdysone 20-monooxygenase [Eumeta japonica]
MREVLGLASFPFSLHCGETQKEVYAFDLYVSVCALMLGTRLGFLERAVSHRAATLAAAVKAHFRAQRDSYYGAPLWKFIPTALYRTFVRSEETIHTIVSELMDEAAANATVCDEGARQIFLKILGNPELDMRDKKAAVIDFITAGMETLANSLVFLLYLLSGTPEWQRRIRDELPSCGELSSEQLASAPALKAAISESFRLLPTAPFLARLLDTPLNLGGYQLAAGTFVLAHTNAACRDDENFWRAKEYIPERWLKVKEPHAASLVAPFGRGRRMCPGKRFVELELQILLAKIMQRWRVEFDGQLDIQFDFLLSPKSPLTKQFTCRLCAASVSLGRWSGREIDRSALSFALLTQAEHDNESCFFHCPVFVQIETVTGSGIRMKVGREAKSGAGTENEIQNGAWVETECVPGLESKSVA